MTLRILVHIRSSQLLLDLVDAEAHAVDTLEDDRQANAGAGDAHAEDDVVPHAGLQVCRVGCACRWGGGGRGRKGRG